MLLFFPGILFENLIIFHSVEELKICKVCEFGPFVHSNLLYFSLNKDKVSDILFII
jgi:hypothetical protein